MTALEFYAQQLQQELSQELREDQYVKVLKFVMASKLLEHQTSLKQERAT